MVITPTQWVISALKQGVTADPQACPSLWRVYSYYSVVQREAALEKRRKLTGWYKEAAGGEIDDLFCYNCAGSGHLGDVSRDTFPTSVLTSRTARKVAHPVRSGSVRRHSRTRWHRGDRSAARRPVPARAICVSTTTRMTTKRYLVLRLGSRVRVSGNVQERRRRGVCKSKRTEPKRPTRMTGSGTEIGPRR